MLWLNEPGFENFKSFYNYLRLQVKQTIKDLPPNCKSLDLVVADAYRPSLHNNKIVITNNWVTSDVFDPNLFEQLPNSWYGGYAGHPRVAECVPNFKFNCFMHRLDTIRQSWLYQFERRRIFDLGLISFNMDISRHIDLGRYSSDCTAQQIFEGQFQQFLQIFQQEHAVLKSKVPYKNFSSDLHLSQIIMQTEFSIVLETYFDNNDIITFSEKIFRCLKLPRPWVMFAMKNAVSYLRDMGFDVLDDLVDHSYDYVDFDINRQVAIMDQIEIMCKQTLSKSQIQRCQQAAEHNQQLLFEIGNRFQNDVNQVCQRAMIKCLESRRS